MLDHRRHDLARYADVTQVNDFVRAQIECSHGIDERQQNVIVNSGSRQFDDLSGPIREAEVGREAVAVERISRQGSDRGRKRERQQGGRTRLWRRGFCRWWRKRRGGCGRGKGHGALVGRLASFWARLADVHANMRANPSPRIQVGDRLVFMATPLPFQFAAVNRTDSGRPDNIHSKQRKRQALSNWRISSVSICLPSARRSPLPAANSGFPRVSRR